MIWVIGYIVIGLAAGLYAATREYQDGSLPNDTTSAGVVGFFVACFWPVVAAIIALGIAAHWIRTRIGDIQ
jgi:Zn-dependent protease with chaperone function